MVLKGGEVDPRLSLSQPQTLKSLSQLFDLRGMAAQSILVARGEAVKTVARKRCPTGFGLGSYP